jgi:hypothetical protein
MTGTSVTWIPVLQTSKLTVNFLLAKVWATQAKVSNGVVISETGHEIPYFLSQEEMCWTVQVLSLPHFITSQSTYCGTGYRFYSDGSIKHIMGIPRKNTS